MIPSIRTFLLINLLLSVTLITSFAVIGNLFLEHREVQKHLDAQLAMRALTISAFANHEIPDKQEISSLQAELNTTPSKLREIFDADDTFASYENVQFVVWNSQGKLLLHTSQAPVPDYERLPTGFSDQWMKGEPWRVYVLRDPKTNNTVLVGEKYELREELESKITQNSVIIMLVSYPFLALMIWVVVGRGLASLKRLTYEISHREANYLAPVETEPVPNEIKPVVAELNRLLYRLRDAFEREKRFAADAAHELRTPLAALKTQAQVALKATSEIERDTALRKVLASVDRSTHVVQQLLTLSRMVPEALSNEFLYFDLARQATEMIADMVPEALMKGTEIEFISTATNPIVNGIPTTINILVRNLVDNAIRYTPEGSQIKVYVEDDEDNVYLRIVDNGPGIPEELRERVFERFFRVLGTKPTGSGLGLGIVQQIAEIHHAMVTMGTPESGVGLEVKLAFPRAKIEENIIEV